MATFYIHGIYSLSQEYSFTAEVEADSAEEAAEKFADEAENKSTWFEIESVEVGKPYDMNGSFSVYGSDEDRNDWENALVEGEGFDGYR